MNNTNNGIVLFCPQCNVQIEASIIASSDCSFESTAHNPIDESDAPYNSDQYLVCQCRQCDQPFFLRRSYYGVPGEFETLTKETLLYPSESKLLPEELPNGIKSAYEQAARSFDVALYEPCALMSRKCLESVCKHLDAKGRNLSVKLTALRDSGHIDQRLLDWANHVRVIGNVAAHDDSPVTKEDARDVFDFTEAILIYAFSLTQRFQRLQARRSNSNGGGAK